LTPRLNGGATIGASDPFVVGMAPVSGRPAGVRISNFSSFFAKGYLLYFLQNPLPAFARKPTNRFLGIHRMQKHAVNIRDLSLAVVGPAFTTTAKDPG
jgi:hypothetical protein